MEKNLVLDFFVDGVVLAAVGDVLELRAVLGCGLVDVDDVSLGHLDSLLVAFDEILDVLTLRFDGFHFILERLHFFRKFTAKLEELLDLVVGSLELVKVLEFLHCILLSLSKRLAQGDEGFALVDRSLHFGCFLGRCHISRNNYQIDTNCKVKIIFL